jgi:predicted lipid-binding transport protein (Tim44 family)
VVDGLFEEMAGEGDGDTDVQIDEIWHLIKPQNGATGWVISGIQPLQ